MSLVEPTKVLAEAKRRIASQKHALLPSRVRVHPCPTDSHVPAADSHPQTQRFLSWMAYSSRLQNKPAMEASDKTCTYCSVPDLISNTMYTASEVWKDARSGILDVEVQSVCGGNCTTGIMGTTATNRWTSVTTYLANVKQQCRQLECEVHLPDTPVFSVTFLRTERPELTICDICAEIERDIPECAACPNDAALSWSFVLKPVGSEDILNTKHHLHTKWWTLERFDVTVHDYSEMYRLAVYPIAPELLGDSTVLDAVGLTDSRKMYASKLRHKTDTELRKVQELEYNMSLEADRAKCYEEHAHTAPTTCTAQHTHHPPFCTPMPVATSAHEQVTDAAAPRTSPHHSGEGDESDPTTTTRSELETATHENTPLSKEQLRIARQRYFETKFAT